MAENSKENEKYFELASIEPPEFIYCLIQTKHGLSYCRENLFMYIIDIFFVNIDALKDLILYENKKQMIYMLNNLDCQIINIFQIKLFMQCVIF